MGLRLWCIENLPSLCHFIVFALLLVPGCQLISGEIPIFCLWEVACYWNVQSVRSTYGFFYIFSTLASSFRLMSGQRGLCVSSIISMLSLSRHTQG